MPVAAVAAPIAGLASSAIGAIAGGSNPRPPSLSPQQKAAQNAALASNSAIANAPATIDPIQQALLDSNIAASKTGANNATTNALSSRGLGRSGLLAEGLVQNENTAQSNQNQDNLALQQQAIQQKDFANQMIASLTSTPNVPGQSTAAAALNGAAPGATYGIASTLNAINGNGGPTSGTFVGGSGNPNAPNTGAIAGMNTYQNPGNTLSTS